MQASTNGSIMVSNCVLVTVTPKSNVSKMFFFSILALNPRVSYSLACSHRMASLFMAPFYLLRSTY